MKKSIFFFFILVVFSSISYAQETKLLRHPSLGEQHIAFSYAADIWVCDLDGQNVKRITSTPAVDFHPHLSPDGKWIAFSSNRRGYQAVFVVAVTGGTPKQLTFHPSGNKVVDWSSDSKSIYFTSNRNSAPSSYNKLWSISREGGPASQVMNQWANNISLSPDGKALAVDKMSRWDTEWRLYRGGQNAPIIILDLSDMSEVLIPCEQTTDVQPVWLKDKVYFLSDRNGHMNIWSYDVKSADLDQITKFTGSDIKTMSGYGNTLIFERDGTFSTLDINNKKIKGISIEIIGDFPWAESKWEDLSKNVTNVSLSNTGKRIVMEARGEIFTVPAENGAARNLTKSSGAADRRPLWSPKGNEIAYFSDKDGKGYALYLEDQSGLKEARKIDIGNAALAWEATWSPDGKYIAFVDDDTRVSILNMESEAIQVVDHAGSNLDRGRMNLTWSPDSKWLAYNKSGPNNFRRIMAYELGADAPVMLTNPFADATSPAWDRDMKHLYFIASTDVALGSGWANTSSMQADPEYAAYVINLSAEDDSPFKPKSDEEEVVKEEAPKESSASADAKEKEKKKEGEDAKDKKEEASESKDEKKEEKKVVIDLENIDRRTIPLNMPEGNYRFVVAGPEGSVFFGEYKAGTRGATVHKYTLKDRKAKEFTSGVRNFTISHDGKKLLANAGGSWKLMNAGGPNGKDGKAIKVNLKVKLDRSEEWKQIVNEAWRYQRDYFYDKNMHGRDWDEVYKRYSPLIGHIKHRFDLTYILDQMNGELSVGHSFVFGGDYPKTERAAVGLLGADLGTDQGKWKIERILTSESWNPGLVGPLDRPGIKIEDGYYLLGVNGVELTAEDNVYEAFDGTAGEQTIIHVSDKPLFDSAWQITIEPLRSENSLRRRTWIEDNRRKVDELSGGKLAYVWVPNTGGPGFDSFNRYFFGQQDKLGAVIDERFNGGGLLDDYMVDLMTRKLRAAITNEVPNGAPMRLPAGILGPKALLINEMAGSGGDFFPWVFRHQNAGPLIGATTWGGLVKSSVHYGFIDGGAMTAPDNAVFDPDVNDWVGENKGIAPDIPVRQDAKALEAGGDPQLERAVSELLKMLEDARSLDISNPPYPTPAVPKRK